MCPRVARGIDEGYAFGIRTRQLEWDDTLAGRRGKLRWWVRASVAGFATGAATGIGAEGYRLARWSNTYSGVGAGVLRVAKPEDQCSVERHEPVATYLV